MTGKQLQPEQRDQMIKAVQILSQTAKRQYRETVRPIHEQAQIEGIDPNLIFRKGIMDESQDQQRQPQGKVAMSNKDGVTKWIPADKVEEARKFGFEKVKQ
jgi:phage terminase small subunit